MIAVFSVKQFKENTILSIRALENVRKFKGSEGGGNEGDGTRRNAGRLQNVT